MENQQLEKSEESQVQNNTASYDPISYFPHNRDYASITVSASGFSQVELTPEDIKNKKKELLHIIKHEEARRKNQRTAVLVSLAVFMTLLTLLSKYFGHFNFTNWIGIIFAFSGIAAAFSARQRQAAVELAQFDDISLSGILVEQLATTDKPTLSEIQKALTRLLLKFEDKDSHLLSKDQIATLTQRLKINNPVPNVEVTLQFRLAIIKAMKRVANQQALLSVEAIARGGDAGKYYPELVLAAEEALPEIRARVARLIESNTLLRASAPELSPPNELLRPASGVGEITSNNLLRPSHLPLKTEQKE